MVRKVNLCLKRIFDICFALLALILTSPFWIIGMFGILVTMPGPVFFTQERVGSNAIDFKILKLRTMMVNKELEKNRDMSHDDERKTAWGNLLRRCKIDELPQLINVLKGDMSIVGPRPTVREHVVLYDEREKHRLDVRPGMTGLAQINGNAALVWEDRISYDLMYVEKLSILLDLKIILKTVMIVIFGEENFYHPLSDIKQEDSKYYW
ncbi:sugar transferase [Lachnospiraceae bacterium 45-P1]